METSQNISQSKSFLDKFFDRELNTSSKTTCSKQVGDVSKQLSNVSLKNENNNGNTPEPMKNANELPIKDADKEDFVNKFFESSCSSRRESKSRLSISLSNSYKKKAASFLSFDDKLNYLKSFVFNDKISTNLRDDYVRIHDLFSRSIFDLYFSRVDEQGCQCFKNGFECCLVFLSNKQKETNDNQENLKTHLTTKCCKNCADYTAQMNKVHKSKSDWLELLSNSIDIQFLNELLEINELIVKDENNATFLSQFQVMKNCNCMTLKNKLKCCLEKMHGDISKLDKNENKLAENFLNMSCCLKCNEAILNDNNHSNSIFVLRKSDSLDSPEELKNIISSLKQVEHQQLQNQNQSKLINNISKNISVNNSMSTPRKAIIKNGSKSSKSSMNSSTRKSVTFEDPKYGFILLPIPEWQENLREPVYSKKMSKYLP